MVPSPPAMTGSARSARRRSSLVGTLDVPDILGIADRLERDIRGAQKVVLPDIGHLVNLEAPARFRALVTDFLSNR